MKIKKINFIDWWSSITLDKFVLFFFLLINVGFYYGKYLFLIQPTYGILFFGFAYKLLVKRKLIHKKYLLISLLFASYAFFSTIWAYDSVLAASSSLTLFKYVVISIMLISLLDSKENVKFSLLMLAVSGLVYSLLYISMLDISTLGFGRVDSALSVDEDLPNVNIVGMIVSNSFICFLYFFFNEKKKWAIILAALAFIIIIFSGSRKSILFSIIGVLLIFFRLKGTSKFSLTFLFIMFIQLVVLFIPVEYFSFILNRFGELKFFSTVSKLSASDQIRVDFINYSIQYFNINPFFGHGYYNFSSLFYHDRGFAMYSHNNFMEIVVGLGIFGIIIYYSLYFLIAKKVGWPKKFNFQYLILILIGLNVFNHFFIVVLNERFTWMLLPVLYAGAMLFGDKKLAYSEDSQSDLLYKNTYNK